MELQADCFAGVWANLNDQVKNRLQPGDVEDGLNAASQIGDDMIQKSTQGRVVPDAFTHGSSAQRVQLVPRRPRERQYAELRHVHAAAPERVPGARA